MGGGPGDMNRPWPEGHQGDGGGVEVKKSESAGGCSPPHTHDLFRVHPRARGNILRSSIAAASRFQDVANTCSFWAEPNPPMVSNGV